MELWRKGASSFVVFFLGLVDQDSFFLQGLADSDIRQRRENDITRVATVLFISRVDASILLRHYNWNVSEVHEAWFANEEHVRRIVGLLEKPVVQFPNARELTCGICFETYPCSRIESVACGHPYEISTKGSYPCSRIESVSCGCLIGKEIYLFPGTYLGVVEKLDHLKIFGTEIAYSEEEIDLVRNLLARHLLQHIDE
ncbi:hypothetical protein K1719_007272 [Acacia pycnantha]|nr:hypothetical protein K1719_007272 [Acacia pycnantha]